MNDKLAMPLVMVVWEQDSDVMQEWEPFNEIEPMCSTITSVGYLIQTPTQLCVSPHLMMSSQPQAYGAAGHVWIPNRSVVGIYQIKAYGDVMQPGDFMSAQFDENVH